MEIVKVKTETTIVFDTEELELLRALVERGAMNLDTEDREDDLKEYAEYFTITTNDL